MRIGIEAARLKSYGRGIDRHTCELVKAVSDADRRNEHILIPDSPSVKHDFGLADNVFVEKLNRLFRMVRRSGVAWIGKRRFRDLDLVHCPNSDIWYSKYCKTVVTVHDLAPRIIRITILHQKRVLGSI